VHLIVGLGNPGRPCAGPRHNWGFIAVEVFAPGRGGEGKRDSRTHARLCRTELNERPVLLCEPETFMNLSGRAVQAVAAYHKIDVAQLLVVVDDADLPLGSIRLRPGGSCGGHHGLESIEQHLGTRDYARLRLGIGRQADDRREITDYVLGRFLKAEQALLEAVLERACDQMECWAVAGMAKAMNEFNGTVKTPLVKES